MSTLLFLRLLNGPRFLNRTSTDSIFAFRVASLRSRSRGEVFERIEAELKAQFLLNWTGDPPAMFIYGDSPDRDERSQGALVIGFGCVRFRRINSGSRRASVPRLQRFGFELGRGQRFENRRSVLWTRRMRFAFRPAGAMVLNCRSWLGQSARELGGHDGSF